MATKTWKIEKDLCRCCHAEGAFDNLAEPRTFLDKVEVYSDMLRECLDIDIPPVPGELCAITYTICNACIARLRDACNFKKQVQDCEQRFMTLYYKNAIQGLKPATKVKEEIEVSIERPQSDTEADNIVLKKEDEDDDDDHFLGGDDDDGMSDDDLPIKPPKQSVSTMKTRPKPKPKPKAPPVVKKLKPPPKPKKKEEPKPAKEKKGWIQRVRRGRDYRTDGDGFICSHCEEWFEKVRHLYRHLHKEHIVNNTEKGKRKKLKVIYKKDYTIDGAQFVCSHCNQACDKVSAICHHVRTIHFNIVKPKPVGRPVKRVKDYLTAGGKFLCAHCDETYDEMSELFTHIREEHYDAQNLQVKSGKDYKMFGDEYLCTHCKKLFERIKPLYLHIITDHYKIPNNQLLVRSARDYMKDGDRFVCRHCDKICVTSDHIYNHLRNAHSIIQIPRYTCAVCNTGFQTETEFVKHKLEEHNLDERYECKACNAKFNAKHTLSKHVSGFHLQGKKRKCPLCDYEAYHANNMNRHMYIHKTEKSFKCKFCKKAYLRLATLRLHERIHTGDRRYKCQVCDKTFVQKASLNYHMAKYHPEVNF
ncbi:zinc finger protein 320-like isoform X1 [Maniola jurtina]|uniref:zinc finger protein 320-like isoform X1 n=1 Tax=Maniola jurtina TaxID=191418 RepID=UPI001E68DECF|nr:zinc finger protein 320-like isoform X1 [Maniola jurtina]